MLFLLLATVTLFIPTVELHHEVEQVKMWKWDKIVRKMRSNHSHKDLWELRLHSSESTSSESSSEESSEFRPRLTFPIKKKKPPSGSRRSESEYMKLVRWEMEEKPLVAQAFMFFVNNWGCSNVSGLQHFFASYNAESAEDAMITMNEQHELLTEMSTLARQEIENANSAEIVNKNN